MSHNDAFQTALRPVYLTVLVVSVLLSAVFLGVLVHQSLVSPFSSAQTPTVVKQGDQLGLPGAAPSQPPRMNAAPPRPPLIESAPDRQLRAGVSAADGVVPDGVTVFDDAFSAVADLDPDLLGALRLAATDAADDGIELIVNSGWRSPSYQERLLLEAVSQYGSEEEAARWVATPTTSAHVSGDAVDIGPSDAAVWLSTHGDDFGLCQIYGNEPWHYELHPEAIDHGCPPPYADPSHDPRMQR